MRRTMQVPFIKMHGLGNDFVVLDARERSIPDQRMPEMTGAVARALADRREGVGCDQVIVLEPSDTCDFTMRIFNADGTEAEACGNAARAVALLHGRPARVNTAGGVIALEPAIGPETGGASVDMGAPRFDWVAIPLAYAMDTVAMPLSWDAGDITLAAPMAVNVGNPHAVFFVADANAVPLGKVGPEIERDPVFPQGVNVNVASVAGTDHLTLHVWERGAGLTRACGTGACATAVAAIRKGLVKSPVRVRLPGGELEIAWQRAEDGGGTIRMTGPAKEAFRGTFEWDDFA